jgi:hypothetical protein
MTIFSLNRFLADPSHSEMTSGGPELTVAILPRSGKVTLTTMEARLPVELFEGMLKASIKGCNQIHDILNTAAIEHATNLLKRRRGGGGGAGGAGAGNDGAAWGERSTDTDEGEEGEGGSNAAGGAGGYGEDEALKRAIEASLEGGGADEENLIAKASASSMVER